MGTTLTGTFVSDTYDALIKVTDNNVITSTLKRFTDGFGNDLPILASNTSIQFDSRLLAESIEFNTATLQTADAVGKLVWNDNDGTLDLSLKGGNVTLQIGQESVVRVVNKTGATLTEAAYQAVRVSTAQGQRLGVALAQANSDANSADTIGIVTETIANNQDGFVTTSGIVRGINTTGSLQGETWEDGDMLYLSGTTAGRITNVKPSAPIHTVIIGYVVYAHGTQGKIFVKVDNGYELDELHNVSISSPQNGQALIYDSATSLWKNTGNIRVYNDSTADGISVINSSNIGYATISINNNVSSYGYMSIGGSSVSPDFLSIGCNSKIGFYPSDLLAGLFLADGKFLLGGSETDNGTTAKLQVNGGISSVSILNMQTASYTLALTDQSKVVEMNVGSANNLTVPPNTSVSLPIGTQIDVIQKGTGQTTIVAGSGVNLRSSGGALKLYGQYSACTLIKRDTDEWYVVGDLTT